MQTFRNFETSEVSQYSRKDAPKSKYFTGRTIDIREDLCKIGVELNPIGSKPVRIADISFPILVTQDNRSLDETKTFWVMDFGNPDTQFVTLRETKLNE